MRRLLALGLGCSFLLVGTAHAATTHVVTIGRDSYSPRYLRIAPGDTVTWRNADREVHTATSLPGSPGFFGTGALRSGQQYSQTFIRPGRYGYLNAVRPRSRQRGVIQVGPDIAKPRVSRFSVRATAAKVVVKASFSEDVRIKFVVRRGSKRVLRARTVRAPEGGYTLTYTLAGTAALKAGSYRATLEAIDVVGNRSSARTTFRVK